jgi:DNA gyrase/topoisomerase IV subunit A
MTEQTDLLSLGKDNTKEYGEYVIQQRSLVDYRDALKPVARRIIWAMGPGKGNLNLKPGTPFKKSARVVGDTMGKYHPHGDVSIYEALVNMAQSNYFTHNLIEGEGSFGGWDPDDKAAAYRYTECRLTKLAWEVYLDPDYLEVTKLESNYDGQEQEPFVLPCKLPMILLNGTFGIAVGAMGAIPPIHPDTIKKMIDRWFAGKEVTSKFIFKHLKFNWFYGSECISADEDIMKWINAGQGSLYFCPNYTLDVDKRLITFTDVPPFFNLQNVFKKLGGEKPADAKKFSFVSSFNNYTDKTTVAEGRKADIEVKLKSTVGEDFKEKAQLVIDLFTNAYKNKANVTYRHTSEKVEFQRYSIPAIFNAWMEYRVALEVKMQKNRIKNLKAEIANRDLLILVTNNLDLVINTIRKSMQPKEDLMEKLDLTKEQAEYILDLQLRRISRLDQQKVIKQRRELVKQKKQAIQYRDTPKPKVQDDLIRGFALLEKA